MNPLFLLLILFVLMRLYHTGVGKVGHMNGSFQYQIITKQRNNLSILKGV